MVKMLVTKYTEFHKTLEEVEYKTFKTNVNARDNKGWTPVAIACFHNHAKVVRFLLENGTRGGATRFPARPCGVQCGHRGPPHVCVNTTVQAPTRSCPTSTTRRAGTTRRASQRS